MASKTFTPGGRQLMAMNPNLVTVTKTRNTGELNKYLINLLCCGFEQTKVGKDIQTSRGGLDVDTVHRFFVEIGITSNKYRATPALAIATLYPGGVPSVAALILRLSEFGRHKDEETKSYNMSTAFDFSFFNKLEEKAGTVALGLYQWYFLFLTMKLLPFLRSEAGEALVRNKFITIADPSPNNVMRECMDCGGKYYHARYLYELITKMSESFHKPVHALLKKKLSANQFDPIEFMYEHAIKDALKDALALVSAEKPSFGISVAVSTTTAGPYSDDEVDDEEFFTMADLPPVGNEADQAASDMLDILEKDDDDDAEILALTGQDAVGLQEEIDEMVENNGIGPHIEAMFIEYYDAENYVDCVKITTPLTVGWKHGDGAKTASKSKKSKVAEEE